MSVEFHDFSLKVKGVLDDKAEQFLEEAGLEIESATKRNCDKHVRSGQLKGSWAHIVSGKTVTIGSPLQNAIWEEYGTGEYAANGDGRKGGWVYYDPLYDRFHFTRGKQPRHNLLRAFESRKNSIIRRAREIFGELGK